jgi:hypothetical protein
LPSAKKALPRIAQIARIDLLSAKDWSADVANVAEDSLINLRY